IMFVHLTTISADEKFLPFSNRLHFFRDIKIIMNFYFITATFSRFTNVGWLICCLKIMGKIFSRSFGQGLILACLPINGWLLFNLSLFFSLLFVHSNTPFHLFTFHLYTSLSYLVYNFYIIYTTNDLYTTYTYPTNDKIFEQ